MLEWIAVVVFCVQGQCGFWISTETTFRSQAECETVAYQVIEAFEKEELDLVSGTCAPLSLVRKNA
jgi:hypothetical protein